MRRDLFPRESVRNAPFRWEEIAAFLSVIGAMGGAIAGSLITASVWIVGAEAHPWLRHLGTALLVIAVPLWLLSGCCLDWLEKNTAKNRSSDASHPAT
jgi:hypothetical protein